jgi:hypothetical protein
MTRFAEHFFESLGESTFDVITTCFNFHERCLVVIFNF